jgi:hypothetical protein
VRALAFGLDGVEPSLRPKIIDLANRLTAKLLLEV